MSLSMSRTKTLILLAVVSAVSAAVVSLFASRLPDGLERVAQKFGFAGTERSILDSPAPDYSMPGILDTRLSGATAGLLGAGIAFLSCYLLGRALTAARARRLLRGRGSQGEV